MKRLLLIVNPKAGKNSIRSCLLDIIDIFIKADYDVSLYTTQRKNEIPSLFQKYEGVYDIFVCCGGDGTLNEAVNASLMLENPPLIGYIPSGTVNDFASGNNIPKDPIAAAKRIVIGQEQYYDVGQIEENKKAFIYIAAFGAFTNVSYQTPRETKNALGRFAYLLEGIRQLNQIKTYRMKIEADDRILEGDYIFGMITNSKSVAGLEVPINSSSCYDDGLMEVSIVKNPKTLSELQQLINSLLTFTPSPLLEHFTTSKLTVTAGTEINWTTDGEHGISSKECSIRVYSNRVKIIT